MNGGCVCDRLQALITIAIARMDHASTMRLIGDRIAWVPQYPPESRSRGVPSRRILQPHQKKRTLDNASKFSNHGNQHSKARRFSQMVEMSVEERPLPVPGSFVGQRDRQRANPVPAKPLHCLRQVERAWKLCRLTCVEDLALLSLTLRSTSHDGLVLCCDESPFRSAFSLSISRRSSENTARKRSCREVPASCEALV